MKNIDRAKAIYLAARGASWNLAGDANKPLRQELMTVLTGTKKPIAVCGVSHLDAAMRAELKTASHSLALEREIAAWCGYTGPLQAMAPAKEIKQPETMELPLKFIGSASTDATREILNNIFIDAEKRAVVATNGRILAKLDIPGTAPVKGGMISPQLWKAARAMTKKGPLVLDFVNGTIATLPYPQEQARGSYPNWPAVVPVIDSPVYRLCFDPEILLDLAESLGRHDKAKGVTIDLDASCETPIVVKIAGNSGVIMPMNTKDNPNGHGLRTSNIERPTSNIEGKKEAEHSAPPAVINHLSVSAIDRAEMVRDPIGWLKRLDVELRYLNDFTPHGGYITDYLNLVDSTDYQNFEDAETEKDEMAVELGSAKGEIEELKDLLKSIICKLQSATFESIDSTATTLEGIAFTIAEADIDIPFAYDTTSERIERFAEITLPKGEADFEDMREAYLQKNARVMELEALLATLQTPATPQAERSVSSPSTLNPQPSTSSAPTLTRNPDKNGIELRFPEKPTDEVRAEMKSHGFKWSSKQPGQPWYARYTEERWIFATGLAEATGTLDTCGPEFTPEAMAPAPTETEPQVSPVADSVDADAFADF